MQRKGRGKSFEQQTINKQKTQILGIAAKFTELGKEVACCNREVKATKADCDKQIKQLDAEKMVLGSHVRDIKYLSKFPNRSKGAVERRFFEVIRYQEEDTGTSSEFTSDSDSNFVAESNLLTAKISPRKRPSSTNGTNTPERTRTRQETSYNVIDEDQEEPAAPNAISNPKKRPREESSSSVSSDSQTGDINFSGHVRPFRRREYPIKVPATGPSEDQTSGHQWQLSRTTGATDGPFSVLQHKERDNGFRSTIKSSDPKLSKSITGTEALFPDIIESNEPGLEISNAGWNLSAQDAAEPSEANKAAGIESLEDSAGSVSRLHTYGNATRNLATQMGDLDLEILGKLLRFAYKEHAAEVPSLNSQHVAELQEEKRKSAELEARLAEQTNAMESLTREKEVLANDNELLSRELRKKAEQANYSNDLLSRLATLRQKSGLVSAKKFGT
ncbi:uncharacterized protein BDV14DRAFT_203718 [Aspergillus stella-maris]|uniref:uncharacterized protein n=1 Tax=Aspergillus stella-maris TaxID=1810926 RepID=UPI003CCD9ECD